MTKPNESHRRARLLFGAMCAGLWLAGAPASAAPPAEWQPIGPGGGTVLSLAVDPVDPHTAYAACGAGGLYKTVDAGNSWAHSDTGGSGLLPSILTRVRVDPAAPGTVYAMGAPVTVGSNVFGGGFLKSTDGGATWDGAGSGFPPPLGSLVNDVAFDPRSPGTLYAAAGNRVFKSIDGAVTWTDSGDGLRLGSTVNTVAVDPNQPSTLIAGTSIGVFRSVDAGATWLPVQQGIGRPPVVVLAFDPRTPGLVYAGAQVGNPSAPPGLYVSADDGATWSAQTIAAGNPPVTCLAVAPAGDRAVFACVGDAGLFKAPGAGGPWQPVVDHGLPAGAFASLAIAPAQPSLLYAGTGAANLGPAVYRSLTSGATWRPYGNGIEAVDLTSFAVDPSHQGTVYAGSVGGIQKTGDGGATWLLANTGLGATLDVGALVVDPLAPATLYVDTDGGFFASHDGAAHWLRPGKAFPGVPPLVADPVSPATVYTSTRSAIYRSRNGGATWLQIGPEVYAVEAFAVSPAAPANLYMTTRSASFFNDLFASQDGGANFTAVHSVRADTPLVVADPRAPETIYYKIGDTSYAQPGLYKSTDGGHTATLVIPGDNAALSLVVDPANSAVLYAGYWSGVLVSRDGGATWSELGRLPAPLPVDQLALAPGGFLIARVRGNGLYRLAL